MNKSHVLLLLILLGATVPALGDTIVAPADQVSEFDARQELARVLRRLGRTEAAQNELRKLLEIRPNDPLLLADLADLDASRGHFLRSRDLYERALSYSGNVPELRLRYARQAQSWGDFYPSERIIRAHLGKLPQDIDAALDLAGLLSAEQQYEAAEAEYRALSKRPAARQRALLGLATNRLLEKDYRAVLPPADAVLETDPAQIDALKLRAEALWRLQRYDEAKVSFQRLSALPAGRYAGWVGLGRLALAQKQEATAVEYFRRAQASGPEEITARYFLDSLRTGDNGPVHQEIARRSLTAKDLTTLAGLYASDGKVDSAIALYESALAKDPENFSAQMGLAQVLATAHRYNESIQLLTRLSENYPGNAKITLLLARVLSWSRQYDAAIRTYRELSALNPADTVPLKEMARVAVWDNRMRLARDLYTTVSTPSVDQQLIAALKRSGQDPVALGVAGIREGETNTPYEGYERLRQLLDSGTLAPALRPAVESAIFDLEPVYHLQKATWLESQAKWFSWNKKPLHAAEAYRQLLAFQPGNEEARFDLAQVEASQDLSLKSGASYHELLELDPLHNLASQALERESIRQNPAVFSKYTYWSENGIGRASDIERQKIQSGAEFAWNGQTQVNFSADYWNEAPGSGGYADAVGPTIGVRTVFNEYLRASAEWSYKQYLNSLYHPTNTGQANITFNAWDYLHLTLQYARVDELHNQFGLQQGVQSNNLGLLFDADLNHYLGVTGGAIGTYYSDNNSGIWFTLAPTFILLDHPHTLKLVLRGDYRNTRDASIFEFQGPTLINIIHPYWTPQDYTRGTVILEWRHDLSRDFYAGAQQHYYALRLGGGIDSTGNKDLILEAEWHYDFLPHWSLEARGTVDRSPAWNGAAASLSVIYHF
jgi:tetratricopeptide (TPR) repeat protein